MTFEQVMLALGGPLVGSLVGGFCLWLVKRELTRHDTAFTKLEERCAKSEDRIAIIREEYRSKAECEKHDISESRQWERLNDHEQRLCRLEVEVSK